MELFQPLPWTITACLPEVDQRFHDVTPVTGESYARAEELILEAHKAD